MSSKAQAQACCLETPPKEKSPSISKKERLRPSSPMQSMSLVRTHFWQEQAPISFMVFLPW